MQHRVLVRGAEQVAGVEQPAHLGQDRRAGPRRHPAWRWRAACRAASPSSTARASRISTASRAPTSRTRAPRWRSCSTSPSCSSRASAVRTAERPTPSARGQVGLDQSLAGLEAAGDDRLAQPVLGATGLNVEDSSTIVVSRAGATRAHGGCEACRRATRCGRDRPRRHRPRPAPARCRSRADPVAVDSGGRSGSSGERSTNVRRMRCLTANTVSESRYSLVASNTCVVTVL